MLIRLPVEMRPYDGELKHCPTVYRVGDLDNWRWLQWGIIMYLYGGWNCGAVNLRSGMQIYISKRLIMLNGRIWIRLFHAQRALHLDLRMILDTAQHPNFPSQIAGKENYRVESIVDPKKRKTCTFIFHWRWLQWGSIHFQRIKCMAFSSPW
jgi:hypothetical protein